MDSDTIKVVAQLCDKVLDTIKQTVSAAEAIHVEDSRHLDSEHLLRLRLAQLEFSRHIHDQAMKFFETAKEAFCEHQVERASISRIEAAARVQEAENERARLENERKQTEVQAQHLANQKIWMETKAAEAENERMQLQLLREADRIDAELD